jgi:hypothetical protein
MSGRERLLTVLRGGIPDRLPFVPLVNDFFWDTLPPEWDVHDPVACCRRIGADIAERWVRSYVGYGLYRDEAIDPWLKGITFERSQTSNGTLVRWVTPFGALSQHQRETQEAGSTVYREDPLVKTFEDLRVYQYLWEAMEPRAAYHLTRQHLDAIGDDGIVMVATPCTPMLHLIMYDLGLERTSFFLADHPEAMKRLMTTMADKALAATRIAAHSPAEVGIVPENSGTRLVSPRQFAEFCAPVLSEMASLFHSSGKLLLFHACGHLHDLMPAIAGTGLDGIESLTPPPTGNVELAFAREILGPDKTIIGGLDPVWFAQASAAEVSEKVQAIAEEVRPGRHFMLMPSDSTPAHVPLANFEAVRRTIERLAKNHKA